MTVDDLEDGASPGPSAALADEADRSATLPAGRQGRRSRTDPLTGLLRREELLRRGPAVLARAAGDRRTAVLLMIDLDGFKAINDTAGHDAGDLVLAAVGARLRDASDADDLVVRLGGDEFAVLTCTLPDPESAGARAASVIDALSMPMEVDDLRVAVGASVGLALLGQDGDTVEELLRAADQAMYAAKAAGSSQWRPSTPECRTEAGMARRLLADLDAGIATDQLVMHYQPQVQMSTGTIVGFEALVRWDHPELGQLLPRHFIPLAERSGRMGPITAAVLESVMTDLPALHEAAPRARLSINVTRRLILGRGLVDDLRSRVQRHGLSPGDIVIEITEPVTRTSSETAETFGTLSRRGFEVSIRGFGTARSSLTALWSNPAVREVKVDPSIVRALDAAHGSDDVEVTRLVRALTSAAHSLGIRVVAEGVETATTAAMLQDLGCDLLQGFWLCPPQPLDDTVAWTRAWGRGHVSTA